MSEIKIKMITIPLGGGCNSFQMSETPITVEQWNAVMTNDLRKGQDEWPVTRVNLQDCLDFCAKLGEGYRLPTNQEWGWAIGREPKNLEDYAVFEQVSICPVKTKFPNEYGLYDMRGNIWERVGKKGRLRGGAWNSRRDFARAVFQDDYIPYNRSSDSGFRVVRMLRPPSDNERAGQARGEGK